MNLAAITVDVTRFEAALRVAMAATDVRERIRLLTSAIALYRGELLPGYFEDSIDVERRRLADHHLNALLALASAWKQTVDPAQALEVLLQVVALDPLQEEAHCQVMQIYAATGRLAAAQRQYQRLTEILKEQLGVEPAPETQRLIRTLRLNGKGDEPTSPPSPPFVASPLPAPPESPVTPIPATAPSIPPAVTPMLSTPIVPSPAVNAPRRVSLRARLFLTALLLVLSAGLVWRQRATHRHVVSVPTAETSTTAGTQRGVYGREVWVRSMAELPGDGGSEPTAMAMDDMGDLYITGFVHTAKQDVDYVTLKYDGSGNQIWQRRYNGPANDCDRARSLAVDAAHNVYVTGDSYNGDWEKGGTDYDVVTIKYDADGKRSATWPDVGFGVGVRRYDGAHRADWGRKIALARPCPPALSSATSTIPCRVSYNSRVRRRERRSTPSPAAPRFRVTWAASAPLSTSSADQANSPIRAPSPSIPTVSTPPWATPTTWPPSSTRAHSRRVTTTTLLSTQLSLMRARSR